MQPLSKELRNKFESTVIKAREVSEYAAKTALEQLGVEQAVPYSYMTEPQRELRRRLRVHGRQLGDVLNPMTESQEIERLTEEIAYEYWHRMLFARFLAENQLLMFCEDDDIDNAVAVSLSECEEMAPEMGCLNKWEIASKMAAKMLPQIFRPESPIFELHFSPENQKELERLLSDLNNDTFTASDSLGWAYQFWQSKKKEIVNKSEVKIGARELPAITQLFTEPYMVHFLLDNSLGAWWAKRRLSEDDLRDAATEEDLRSKASLPGVPLEYLRFSKGEDSCWSPAGGTFDGWPESLSELKVLDPCCGSGHFLVSAFSMLVPIRMKLEGISEREACDAVLRENIHGLEIDQRCVEIAAFAVAFAAWKYPRAGGFRNLPEFQIAWCGQSVNVKKEEWIALADGDLTLKMHLEELHELFKDAPILGSLLNPRKQFETGSLYDRDWDTVSKLLITKLEKKKREYNGLGVIAQGMEKAFQLLGDKYHLVITNVPYLKGGDHCQVLKRFCSINYSNSKYDLATVFIERIQSMMADGGVSSVVTQQYWLFLKYYNKMRRDFIKHYKLSLISRLGPGAFDAISGEVVNVCLQIIQNKTPADNFVQYGIDFDNYNSIESKKVHLVTGDLVEVIQKKQLENPDYRISFELIGNSKSLLSKHADFGKGSVTGDGPHYLRNFWENTGFNNNCFRWLNSPNSKDIWSGRENLILWGGNFSPEKELGFAQRGERVLGKKGVAIGKAGKLRFTPYMGELFDDNIAVITPYNELNLSAIWNFCVSDEFVKELRKLDKKMSVTAGTFTKVSYDHELWNQNIPQQDILNPYSEDPTQWIFHGHPTQSGSTLQVAVARLLGYRWPAEIDTEMELSDEARELVRKCEKLLPYADEDGIVCIPSVRGEAPASERLLNLLAAAYEGEDINAKLSELLASCDHMGKSLDSWLKEKFFAQHYKLFGHRPFIWHIWDGLSDGFAAFVNYHKLDRQNLETLIYTYLGDWIIKQKSEKAAGVDGADEKQAAAENLKKSLELILEGEAPYDIFVRWKPLQQQPIGWEPDINDGVRMNIRPFMSVPAVNKKDAGVLRDMPNIKWDKDRGKDTESSPWYHVFNGNRINDYHLTLNEKKKARDEMRRDNSESI